MDLYVFQFHAEHVDLSALSKVNYNNLKILVTCANILNFEVISSYDNRDIHKQFNSGKAVVFASDFNNLVSNLQSQLAIRIVMDDDQIGTANIHWQTSFNSLQEKKHVDNSDTYNILNKANQKIGTIKINLSVAYYGNNIELPIIKIGSQITIQTPNQIRKHSDNNKQRMSERWSPLYISTDKRKRSVMDETMKLYAALAMAEPPMEMYDVLTSEYINKHLCGNKICPGAKKFREFGLGPLAPPGSGLGTVAELAEAKPSGIYGMSQAYGTLDSYGAYGLFVKRKNKTKSACGSPDCPFRDYYYQPPNTVNTDLNKPKKCMCKNCHNSDKNNTCGKLKTANDTCGTPKCCKFAVNDTTKCPYVNSEKNSREIDDNSSGVKCGYLKNATSSRNSKNSNAIKCGDMNKARNDLKKVPRQSAGADKYNPECCYTKCPFSTYQQRKQPSNGNKTRRNNQDCCGNKDCVFDDNIENKKYAPNNTFVDQPSKDKGNCGYDHTLCGDQVCPLDDKNVENNIPEFDTIDQNISNFTNSNWPDENVTHVTILTNDEGKTIAFSAETGSKKPYVDYKDLPVKTKDVLGELTVTESEDLYYLVSELIDNREQTQSMYNYFAADYNDVDDDEDEGEEILQNVTDLDDSQPRHHKEKKKKEKRTYPCTKNSCRALKYTTCSECGGYSRSGATCDNTDVSFSTISYSDSFVNTETKPQEVSQASTVVTPAIKDKETKTKKASLTKLAVKINKKRKKKSRFVYHAGEFYPGMHIGHKTCVVVDKNVPAHMGWLWNIKSIEQKKRRKGWKPGVISKVINDRIIQHRKKRGIPDPPELKMLVPRKRAKVYNAIETDDEEEEEIEPKPTLKVQKKEGNYLITFNPLKNPKTLADNENPYIRCKPMQFLITKTKQDPPPPIITQYSAYEDEDNEMDYEDFYKGCLCDGDTNILDSSSSESELDIEFTTPAGIIIPERMKKKKNVVHIDTQFKDEDFTCADCPIIVPKQFKQRKRAKLRK